MDKQRKIHDIASGEPAPAIRRRYPLILLYAALIGAIAALFTAAFLTVYNLGIQFFGNPSHFGLNVNRFWPLILLTAGGILIGIAIKFTGIHGGLGVAQEQYAKTGRIEPRYLPSILLEAFIALFSGAAVGPEGPLSFLTGGVGTWITDHLRIDKEDAALLVYAAIAGCFGGFFGSPVVGAIGALEYMFIHELDYYRHLIPGLLAASCGYGVYWALLRTSLIGTFSFPNYASPRIIDLLWALVIGLLCGVIGTAYKVLFAIVQRIFAPLRQHPIVLAILGGVIIGLIGSFVPLTLYSGQVQLQSLLKSTISYSALYLLLLLVVKALLTSTSFATGFDGGPIFPLIFIGGTLGLAIAQIFPFIPVGVAVMAAMAGTLSAVAPMPLTIALLLGLLGGQADLTPMITIGAIIGFLTGKALTSLLPKPRSTTHEAGSDDTHHTVTSAGTPAPA
jgi:H+/Cl- antiporter ClcA